MPEITTIPITVAYGDGIGPEIMEAVLSILRHAKAPITIETVEIGKNLYEHGYNSGISPALWESIERTKVLLKAPITTPQGGGYKSLNVTMRKTLGLYANVRPCIAYHPYVATHHPDLDIVIVRENEEDLYTGIEHRQTRSTFQTLKLVSIPGCERIIRYAFDYAVTHHRKKVTCMSKDNIMKMTDGVFHDIFNQVAKEYPQIEANHMIIDIGAAKLAAKPGMFDVVVTSNLYGDIISDIVAEISGSVGLAGSANLVPQYAMFEAIHGSAPDIAGKNMANPSGLLHAAIMMLSHLGLPETAETIHNAWLKTLEDGIHTGDVYQEGTSSIRAGTAEFAKAVIERLGKKPTTLKAVEYSKEHHAKVAENTIPFAEINKQLVGVDVFIDHLVVDPKELAEQINGLDSGQLKLQMISLRGLTVWPERLGYELSGDHWRLRFVPSNEGKIAVPGDVMFVLFALIEAGLDVIKTENLYFFDGKAGFSLGQGE
jgi:isocitrate dehydrogenase